MGWEQGVGQDLTELSFRSHVQSDQWEPWTDLFQYKTTAVAMQQVGCLWHKRGGWNIHFHTMAWSPIATKLKGLAMFRFPLLCYVYTGQAVTFLDQQPDPGWTLTLSMPCSHINSFNINNVPFTTLHQYMWAGNWLTLSVNENRKRKVWDNI